MEQVVTIPKWVMALLPAISVAVQRFVNKCVQDKSKRDGNVRGGQRFTIQGWDRQIKKVRFFVF